MKFRWNVLIQILGIAVQSINTVNPVFGAELQTAVAGGIGVAQAVTAMVAHYRNPDGTSVNKPYLP